MDDQISEGGGWRCRRVRGRRGSILMRSGAGYTVVSDIDGLACDRCWRPEPGTVFAVQASRKMGLRWIPHLAQEPPSVRAAA